MPAGRPPVFKSAKDMQEKIEEYFKDEPILTMTGLALHLGFASRQSMYDYEKNDKYSYTIKRAKSLIELSYEKDIKMGEGTAGHIFALKNFGWTDKQEVEPARETQPLEIKFNVSEAVAEVKTTNPK